MSGGTLVIDGTLTASAVTVDAAGTLAGSGDIDGAVTISGTISAGSSPGTLTTGALTWNGGGTNLWEVTDGGSDLIIADSLTIAATSANKFTINVTALGALTGWNNAAERDWTIVQTTGGITGFSGDKFAFVDNFSGLNPYTTGNFKVVVVGTDLVLRYSTVKAVADSMNRTAGTGGTGKVLASALVANDLVQSGSAAVLNVLGTSTNGGTVSFDGTWVYYTPSGNPTTDEFTYTLTDGASHTGLGTVTVTVAATGTGESANMLTPSGTPGNFTVNFSGIPGRTYTIEWAPTVTGPWTSIGTDQVDANGLGTIIDSTNHDPDTAFYRTVYP